MEIVDNTSLHISHLPEISIFKQNKVHVDNSNPINLKERIKFLMRSPAHSNKVSPIEREINKKRNSLFRSVEITRKHLLKDYMWNKIHDLLEDKKEVVHKDTHNKELRIVNGNKIHNSYSKLENKILLLTHCNHTNELKARKRHLKSISNEEIETHARKYKQFVNKMNEKRRIQLIMKKHLDQMLKLDQMKLKSKYYKQINKREQGIKQSLYKKQEDKKLYRERIKRYYSLIRTTCPIKVSEKKTKEMRKMIAQLNHPVRKPKDVKKVYSVFKLSTPLKKIPNKSVNQPIKFQAKTPITKIDYLKEIGRNLNYSKKKQLNTDWLKDINNSNLDIQSKILHIIDRGKQIEEKADMKLKIMRAGGSEGDLNLGEHGVDMLLHSIKAKISVLKQL